MNLFVLDCSMAIAWCFEDEYTKRAQDVLSMLDATSAALVPSIWPLEISNVLCMSERHGRLTSDQSHNFIELFSALSIEIDAGHTKLFNNNIILLSRTHHLYAYDAAYLELALRYNIPLASLDKKLCSAAKKEGIKVL